MEVVPEHNGQHIVLSDPNLQRCRQITSMKYGVRRPRTNHSTIYKLQGCSTYRKLLCLHLVIILGSKVRVVSHSGYYLVDLEPKNKQRNSEVMHYVQSMYSLCTIPCVAIVICHLVPHSKHSSCHWKMRSAKAWRETNTYMSWKCKIWQRILQLIKQVHTFVSAISI